MCELSNRVHNWHNCRECVWHAIYPTPVAGDLVPPATVLQEHRTMTCDQGSTGYEAPLVYGATLLSEVDTWDAWWAVNDTLPMLSVQIYLTRPQLLQAWFDGGGGSPSTLSYLANLTGETELFLRRPDYNVDDLCVIFIALGYTGYELVTFHSVVTSWY